MTTHDFDQPYMIYEGELPSYLRRKPAQPEQQWTDEDVEDGEGFDWSSLLVIAVVLALGIVIGVCGTLTLRSFSPPPRTEPAAPAPAPAVQLQQDVFASVPGPRGITAPAPPPVTASRRAEAAAPRPPVAKPAVAHASALPPVRSISSAKARVAAPVRPAGPCDTAPTRADRLICANPSLAAADQEMRRAYQRALDAGAPPMPLRASQEDWLIASEVAADRSTLDLAASYARRIAELNALSRREPPH